ncbi:MAG: nucleotidyltransferase family protein [Deltaproteobacteria bacterium]|nr:nucleotidyltransferase family protein [Deltaproteobacteria bacterium]MBI3387692.1 nucleotidyltransferase family protein [Deltaproteobacteria bacterium]
MATAYETRLRESFDATLREASEFFMGRGDLRATMKRLAERFAAEGIAYAVIGGMALGEHGYVRMTDDVDILVTQNGLERFAEQCVGLGYAPTHVGAERAFRDVETEVRIKVWVAGEYPGDGKPKPVMFPDPSTVAIEAAGIRVVSLPRLIELKLASGMTAPDRLRDLADVQELIRAEALDEKFAEQLDESVRSKFSELARATNRPLR